MDFWDLTKLLYRRWYISLPMLVASLIVVGVASQVVEPDYNAKGHVQLVPPPGTTAPDGTQQPIKNPWFDLGYSALGNAAMIDVGSKPALERLANEGLSDNVTIITMDRLPVFEIEVVAESPEQATATVQRVMSLLADAVEKRQTSLNVAPSDLITTLNLDDGSAVEVKSSKIIRVMAVAGGVGLLLTAGVTIAFDAFLRRRASQNQKTDGADANGPDRIAPHLPSGALPSSAAGNASATASVAMEINGKAPVDRSVESVKARSAVPVSKATDTTKPPVGQEYRGVQYRSGQSGPATSQSRPGPETLPPDATIVLPTSGTGWLRDDRLDRR